MQKRILQKLEWEGLGTRLHFSKLGFIHLHDIELGKGLLERVLCMEITKILYVAMHACADVN